MNNFDSLMKIHLNFTALAISKHLNYTNNNYQRAFHIQYTHSNIFFSFFSEKKTIRFFSMLNHINEIIINASFLMNTLNHTIFCCCCLCRQWIKNCYKILVICIRMSIKAFFFLEKCSNIVLNINYRFLHWTNASMHNRSNI